MRILSCAAAAMGVGVAFAAALVLQRRAPAMRPARGAVRASAAAGAAASSRPRSVAGGELRQCCLQPRTGFYRDGYCQTGPEDLGRHTVCAEVTAEFLEFSKARGNDLMTPAPAYGFPGLKPGDKWCLCASRWKEAFDAGVAPKVYLEATHEKTLEFVSLEDLRRHAV